LTKIFGKPTVFDGKLTTPNIFSEVSKDSHSILHSAYIAHNVDQFTYTNQFIQFNSKEKPVMHVLETYYINQ